MGFLFTKLILTPLIWSLFSSRLFRFVQRKRPLQSFPRVWPDGATLQINWSCQIQRALKTFNATKSAIFHFLNCSRISGPLEEVLQDDDGPAKERERRAERVRFGIWTGQRRKKKKKKKKDIPSQTAALTLREFLLVRSLAQPNSRSPARPLAFQAFFERSVDLAERPKRNEEKKRMLSESDHRG